jgi:hypothetical protein
MVWVNNPLIDNDALPFGGWKASGIGRELSRSGSTPSAAPRWSSSTINRCGRAGGIPIRTTGSSIPADANMCKAQGLLPGLALA